MYITSEIEISHYYYYYYYY